MTQSVAVIARFTPGAQKRSTLRALLQGMVGPTRSEPGCLSYDLYEVSEGAELVLFERYLDDNALQEHRATEHYVNYRAQLGDLLDSPISVTVLLPVDEA
jgi:quinol monooxygenase YgiN